MRKMIAKRAFTLIELLVVVAIIGVLTAVGVIAFNNFAGGAKVNATKANYQNFSKWIQTEIITCNTGMADKIFTANPQSCPITAAQTFSSGMNNACRSTNGVFYNIKNPYNKSERACRLSISYTNDSDVGFINWSEKSGSEIRLRVCWKTPCNTSENRDEKIINVTE